MAMSTSQRRWTLWFGTIWTFSGIPRIRKRSDSTTRRTTNRGRLIRTDCEYRFLRWGKNLNRGDDATKGRQGTAVPSVSLWPSLPLGVEGRTASCANNSKLGGSRNRLRGIQQGASRAPCLSPEYTKEIDLVDSLSYTKYFRETHALRAGLRYYFFSLQRKCEFLIYTWQKGREGVKIQTDRQD